VRLPRRPARAHHALTRPPDPARQAGARADADFQQEDVMDRDYLFEDDAFAEAYADDFSGFDEYDEEDYLGESDLLGFDGEADEFNFLKKAWSGIKKAGKTLAPIAKKLAPIAGKAIGGAFGGPAGAMLGGKVGSFVSNLEDEELVLEGYNGYGDYEDESDSEDEMNAEDFMEFEGEDEDVAEYMADIAAKAPNPIDSGAMAGAITITIASKAPLQVKAVSPTLSSGAARLTKLMKNNPATKPLVKVVPTIAKKTVATLARKAAKGKPVTPTTAKRVMAKQAMRVLSNPRELTKAIAKNEAKKRKVNMKVVKRAERYA
jgi:hypothetical protein